MTIFYIKMKIRAGGGALGQEGGGALGQHGAPPCYSSVWETLHQHFLRIRKFSRGFNFRKTLHMRSFVKIKPW